MKSLAIRRSHIHRLKKNAMKIASSFGIKEPNDRQLGLIVSTHGVGCSCRACGNPRRYSGQRTMQELRFAQDEI
jgi:hypothetical protein